jgi:hypothetical protein
MLLERGSNPLVKYTLLLYRCLNLEPDLFIFPLLVNYIMRLVPFTFYLNALQMTINYKTLIFQYLFFSNLFLNFSLSRNDLVSL